MTKRKQNDVRVRHVDRLDEMDQDARKQEPHLDPKPAIALPGIVYQDEPGIRCVEADQDQEDSSNRSVEEGSHLDQEHPDRLTIAVSIQTSIRIAPLGIG